MTQVSMEEIGRDPVGFLARVRAGEAFVIVEAGRPVAEVTPATLEPTSPRPDGLAEGEFEIPDSFFDPLPEEILRDFEGR